MLFWQRSLFQACKNVAKNYFSNIRDASYTKYERPTINIFGYWHNAEIFFTLVSKKKHLHAYFCYRYKGDCILSMSSLYNVIHSFCKVYDLVNF